MWWHRLIDGEAAELEPMTLQEVPDDTGDAFAVQAHTRQALARAEVRGVEVNGIVGSLSGHRQRNHFSQMAIESMARIKD